MSRGNLPHFQGWLQSLECLQLLYALPLLKGLEFSILPLNAAR